MSHAAITDRRSSLTRLALAGVVILAVCAGCQRTEPAKTKGAGAIQATSNVQSTTEAKEATKLTSARDVLKQMIAAYRKASNYQDQGTVHLLAEADGKTVRDMKARFSMAFERPNKLRVEAYGGRLVCDGKKLFAADEDVPGQVILTDAPQKLTIRSVYRDLILTDAMTRGFGGGMPQVILALAEKPMDVLVQGGEPVLAEDGQIDRRDYYRVKINVEMVGTTTFWIDQKTFLLRRVILPTDGLRQMLSQELPIDSISVVAEFPGASFDTKIDPTAFQYEVPKGAEAVAYLIPRHMGQLLKSKMPAFKFQDLDGKPVTPEMLSGKTVVLDFWSVGYDCKQNLLDLEQVYQRHKGNPKVAFYAVCVDPLQLKNEDAAKALADLKVHVPLLRDPDQSAAAFRLPQPPTVFIISDKGIVQHCECGYSLGFAKLLSEKLDRVLAGQDIYQEALKQYEQQLNALGEYAKLADQPEEVTGAAQGATEVKLPEPKTASRTEPTHLKLTPLWKCTDIKSPGNIVALTGGASGPRLLVVEGWRSLAEVGLDGKVVARHTLNLAKEEAIGCLRTATAADGRRYVAAFFWLQQRCHVLDDKWNVLFDYPQDALQNRHSGITDVQLGDLDGSGQLTTLVSYAGLVGVQGAAIDGKRLWSNRSVSNVSSLAIVGQSSDRRRELLCAKGTESLAVLDAGGNTRAELRVPGQPLRRIAAADLRGDGQSLLCGIVAAGLGENVAIGFSSRGEEQWRYRLPDGIAPQPVEPIIAGRVSRQGPGQWLLPGPDGSIHILAADGQLVDKFSYGEPLQGLATIDINGRPALVVATAKGLEAWGVD